MIIPYDEMLLFLQPGQSPRFQQLSQARSRHISEILASRSDAKFTLVIGNFGLGKTTAALLGASELRSKGSPIAIYAECGRLSLQAVGRP